MAALEVASLIRIRLRRSGAALRAFQEEPLRAVYFRGYAHDGESRGVVSV